VALPVARGVPYSGRAARYQVAWLPLLGLPRAVLQARVANAQVRAKLRGRRQAGFATRAAQKPRDATVSHDLIAVLG
jgi:hypothetical protein